MAKKPAATNTSENTPAKTAGGSERYELAHDALLYQVGDITHDLSDEVDGVTRGRVFTQAELPDEALERGLETGALVAAGQSDSSPGET